jgi:putative transposase
MKAGWPVRTTPVQAVIPWSIPPAAYIGMEPPTVRKTFKYQLNPTPEQERALDTVLLRCRKLYNCVLELCPGTAQDVVGARASKSATSYQQAMELPDLKATCPAYAEVHSQVLQDVLRRVDKTSQAFFRRVVTGDRPGYPRFQSARR